MTTADPATPAAIAHRLSPTQQRVLAAAAAGHLYQSRAISTINRFYVDGGGSRPVTGTVQILRSHQLLRTGAHDERRRRWSPTDLGAAVLAELAGDRGDIDVGGLALLACLLAFVLAALGVFGEWAL